MAHLTPLANKLWYAKYPLPFLSLSLSLSRSLLFSLSLSLSVWAWLKFHSSEYGTGIATTYMCCMCVVRLCEANPIHYSKLAR